MSDNICLKRKKMHPVRCDEKPDSKASTFLTHCVPHRMLNRTELRAVVLQPTSSKHEHETAFGVLGLNYFNSPLWTTEFTDPITRGQRCSPHNHKHVVMTLRFFLWSEKSWHGTFCFNQLTKRESSKYEPPQLSGFQSDEKGQCGTATLNCL